MLAKYVEAFEKLRSDTGRARWSSITKHRAPHKPLLLLAVLDSISQGAIKNNLIELTPDLCETFTLYWARVMPPDRRGDIATPFFHLTSEGFWHLVPRPGKEDVVASSSRFRSINELNEVALGVKLTESSLPRGLKHSVCGGVSSHQSRGGAASAVQRASRSVNVTKEG